MSSSFKIGLVCFMFCFSFMVRAENINVTVKLNSIVAINQSESGGDEVYFTATQYSNKKNPDTVRIPMFPQYWLTQDLQQISEMILWKDTLVDTEVEQVIFSLIEHDAPPWNVDDHIGSVKVTFRNEEGKIHYKWSLPDYKDQPEVVVSKQTPGTFTLKGEQSEYKIVFAVETSNSHKH